jgi:hypothetical protein
MTRLAITSALAALTLGAAPAAASACELPATTKAFASFGDLSDYFLASGGDFESDEWTLNSGASRVDGSSTFALAPGSRVLRVDGGGSAVSPTLCVSNLTPHLRFVARASNGNTPLEVHVRRWEDGKVIDQEKTVIDPGQHRQWSPSRNVSLRTDTFADGATADITFTFRLPPDNATWLVDDVFVDPYRR